MPLPDETELEILNRINLEAAVKKLSPKQRAVLALRLQGYSQREVAAKIGLTRPAVGAIQKQAIERLRRELGTE